MTVKTATMAHDGNRQYMKATMVLMATMTTMVYEAMMTTMVPMAMVTMMVYKATMTNDGMDNMKATMVLWIWKTTKDNNGTKPMMV